MDKIQSNKVGCNKCGSVFNQVKQGKTSAGSQRVRCNDCGNRYTPIKKIYSDEIKRAAVRAYMLGNSARKVGRMFNLDGNTVTKWVIFFHGASAIREYPRTSQS